MFRFLFLLLGLTIATTNARAQSIAQNRASRLGLGMNLSYLDWYWDGSRARHFSDFVKPANLLARQQKLADLARAGFKTVRIPVCFSAWASLTQPYRWDAPEQLAAPDSLISWALANKLTVLIDLHHTEFDRSIVGADSTARIVWLWQQIAQRYRLTDPERVLFELRNEPNGMTAAAWRTQAEQLIQTVRGIAPNHTLVVGFHDWNSPDALMQSRPFSDPNLIYTFHFYDPFIFTHQGATWSGDGISDLKNIPFPANPTQTLPVPTSAKGTWVETAINNYRKDATYDVIYKRLEGTKNWATANNVPIFLGEFGSYNLYADTDSRCRHAEAIYYALGKLQIPSAWWEWDGGFTMYEPNTPRLLPCMQEALNTYVTGRLNILGTEPARGIRLRAYPNPTQDGVHLEAAGDVIGSVRVVDATGRGVAVPTTATDLVPLSPLAAGTYLIRVYDRQGEALGTVRVVKQ